MSAVAVVSHGSKPKGVGVLYNGEVRDFAYHPNELVSKLLAEALAEFQIVNQPHLYGLFDEHGNELPDGERLKKAGVDKGDEVVLRQSEVRGG